MNRTRLGFIGAGGIAMRHTKVLLDFPDVFIAAFADSSLNRAQELAALASAKAYADFRQMLDREQLDALYICVPPFAHGEIERAALGAGYLSSSKNRLRRITKPPSELHAKWRHAIT